jgi:glycosyltransferase 2 family protein
MVEQIIQRIGHLRLWYSARRNHRAFRLFRGISVLGILTLCLWFIWQQISAGYTAISMADLHFEPVRLALSWLCIAAATALGAWEWVLLVKALGGNLDLTHGISIHLTSNLTKYLPGSIWPFASKAYLATRRGVPTSLAALSIVGELVIVYLDAILLMLLCLPFSGIVSWTMSQRIAFQAGAILLTGLSLVAAPRIARRMTRRLAHARSRPDPLSNANSSLITFVMAAVLLTWCLLGFGFSTLYAPVSSVEWSHLLRYSFALAAALLLGQVVFFVPTGLGVREAVFVALLASGGTAALVVILAVAFRILGMVAEVLCALVAWIVSRLSDVRKTQSSRNSTNG